MRKVLIASANPWSFCMAVERDIAAGHAAVQVDAINMFRLCSRMSPHWRVRDRVIETLDRKIERFVMPAINGREITDAIEVASDDLPPLPASLAAMRDYRLGEAHVGLAVLSSVASLTTLHNPSTLDQFGPVLASAWRTAHLSLRIGQAVGEMGYDAVYIFNGRHCYSRPFCDVIEPAARMFRYEQGGEGNRYICADRSLHDPAVLAQIIEEQAFDPGAGAAFFEQRLERSPTNEVQLMTSHQIPGALPPDLQPGKVVSFFTSSSDEQFAISEGALFGNFATQFDITLELASLCAKAGLQLVVRLHPHLRFKHSDWALEWDFGRLREQGVIVLEPTDDCDSYALIRASRCMVASASTIGFEAVYLGVPAIVVGDWITNRLGAAPATDSAHGLAEFIAAPALLPHARDRALRFGSFNVTGGKTLPLLDVGHYPHEARIEGRIVDPIRFAVNRVRGAFSPTRGTGDSLDVRSGMHKGRVLLAPGTDYSTTARK